jgi:hypothetical protein
MLEHLQYAQPTVEDGESGVLVEVLAGRAVNHLMTLTMNEPVQRSAPVRTTVTCANS